MNPLWIVAGFVMVVLVRLVWRWTLRWLTTFDIEDPETAAALQNARETIRKRNTT